MAIPGTGRFIERDGGRGTQNYPASQNHYAYANGNPADLTDLTLLARQNSWLRKAILHASARGIDLDIQELTRSLLDVTTSVLPVVGEMRAVYEAISGQDLITGRNLSPEERWRGRVDNVRVTRRPG